MENAADALKIAFAVFIFVIAITISFSLISQAKTTADAVVYATDETNYQEQLSSEDGSNTVGIDTVISTMYRYYKQSIYVKIIYKDGTPPTVFTTINGVASTEEMKENLDEFAKELLSDYSEEKFKQQFDEVTISGKYITGSDGSQVTLSSGGKMIYITYTEV